MSSYDDDYEPHVPLNAAEWEDQEAYDALEAEQVATPAMTLDELAASNPDSMPF